MAENSTRHEVRKLRKKLRQIEHLERLERDLTQEEYEKVLKKSDIRELLKDKLEKLEKENAFESITEMMDKNVNVDGRKQAADVLVNDDEATAKPVPAEETTDFQNKLSECKTSAENMESSGQGTNQSQSTADSPFTEKDNHQYQTVTTTCVSSTSSGSWSLSNSNGASSAVNTSSSSMKQGKKSSAGSGVCQWQERKFAVKVLEGHNDQVFSVAMDGSILISGSRDTMLKVWDCDSGREVRSCGGHTGGITSVVLIGKGDQDCESSDGSCIAVTGSHDCSVRIWSLADGKTLRSIYAYSPVLCLDRRKGNLISGSEGGKLELWDLEVGENICSSRSDDSPVTCVESPLFHFLLSQQKYVLLIQPPEEYVDSQIFKDDRVVSGSSTGVVRLWDVRQRSLQPALSSESVNVPSLKKRRIHCLATTDSAIYWGDDGANIKVLDIRAGKVRKLKNHLTEFGSTSAMFIQDSFLITSGYDIDRGSGYLNVRTLPDEDYLATLDDDVTSYISCLSCTELTRDGVVCQRLCTGGSELKVWDQLSKNKVRKRTRSDEDSSFVTSKQLRRYSSAEPIDTESSDESDDERRDDSSDDDDDNERTATNARQSWCVIS